MYHNKNYQLKKADFFSDEGHTKFKGNPAFIYQFNILCDCMEYHDVLLPEDFRIPLFTSLESVLAAYQNLPYISKDRLYYYHYGLTDKAGIKAIVCVKDINLYRLYEAGKDTKEIVMTMLCVATMLFASELEYAKNAFRGVAHKKSLFGASDEIIDFYNDFPNAYAKHLVDIVDNVKYKRNSLEALSLINAIIDKKVIHQVAQYPQLFDDVLSYIINPKTENGFADYMRPLTEDEAGHLAIFDANHKLDQFKNNTYETFIDNLKKYSSEHNLETIGTKERKPIEILKEVIEDSPEIKSVEQDNSIQSDVFKYDKNEKKHNAALQSFIDYLIAEIDNNNVTINEDGESVLMDIESHLIFVPFKLITKHSEECIQSTFKHQITLYHRTIINKINLSVNDGKYSSYVSFNIHYFHALYEKHDLNKLEAKYIKLRISSKPYIDKSKAQKPQIEQEDEKVETEITDNIVEVETTDMPI